MSKLTSPKFLGNAKKKKKPLLVLFSVALLACLLFPIFSNFKIALGDNSGVGNSDPNSWPMFRNDLAHSGYSTSTGPIDKPNLVELYNKRHVLDHSERG